MRPLFGGAARAWRHSLQPQRFFRNYPGALTAYRLR
jgi:hypothetical protein